MPDSSTRSCTRRKGHDFFLLLRPGDLGVQAKSFSANWPPGAPHRQLLSFCLLSRVDGSNDPRGMGSAKRLRPCNSRSFGPRLISPLARPLARLASLLDDGLLGDGFFHGDDPFKHLLGQARS